MIITIPQPAGTNTVLDYYMLRKRYKVEPYHMYIGVHLSIHQDDDAMEWVSANRKSIKQHGDIFVFLDEETLLMFRLKYLHYMKNQKDLMF